VSGRKLSYEKVIAAAIKVARAEGLSAVSMRRVGRELGVEAMSLYAYVDSKDDLILAMVESLHAYVGSENDRILDSIEQLCGSRLAVSDLAIDPNADVVTQDIVRARRVLAVAIGLAIAEDMTP
jgi:AcrR family transcriptional regulator